jgi:hypothetical protein
MANPNIINATTLNGRYYGRELNTTTTTGIVTCASNKIYKINALYVANKDGTNACDVTIKIYDASESANVDILSTIPVPAEALLTVIAKDAPIYLEESDEIRAGASSSGDLNIHVSWDEIS